MSAKNIYRQLKVIGLLVWVGWFVFVSKALAGETVGSPADFNEPSFTSIEHLREIITIIINLFIKLLPPVVVIFMLLYAAFTYITSQGDTDKIGDAKKTATFAAIGFVLIVLAYTIINVLNSTFLSNSLELP